MSADNQQERLKAIGWVLGFVDGEGCFSISVQKNPSMRLGWQIFPEFVVTQGKKSRQALQSLKDFFECGNIYKNKRYDNHRENLYRYCVRSIKDLREKIIPFFKENQLKTSKLEDFKLFLSAMEMIERRRHLDIDGLKELARCSQKMNRNAIPKFLASSETACQTPSKSEKIQSVPCSDAGRLAEMTNPPEK